LLFLNIASHNLCSLSRKYSYMRRTNAAGTTGHQSYFAREPSCHDKPPSQFSVVSGQFSKTLFPYRLLTTGY
jgi:hypothetical protein